ncbi:cytochrome D ubiquinol oxidase subunit II [Carbonactinospora thermoautotrophica]|uniref:cytochrome d ubiquinol oxidase subunit II n=1 Tax=Carbonactinospora thermoautotrophica TaxID=1469144 RepID=UPI002270A47E|nr:cytochrome d ubiquinol oxidase subunit II [Carbonactinospora thermoautotrophica]MCX9192412.1 cytochrome D ubiquinol oxidase subunit II [Carbonactinospora thermoautotrophica]
MTAAQWLLLVAWAGLTLYVLFAGADFGGGFWDLLAGGDVKGMPQRRLIEHSIGPVWEANHVWLIFVIVMFWTGFPAVFASVASTMYIPLTLVAFGIIARGAAFAFRKASTELWQQRLFGAAFALSSVLTPFFLGTVAGGVASGRVPLGIARGDLVASWLNPTSVLAGLLAVGTTAYLAAAYLTADARRQGQDDLAEAFRRRALVTGAVTGAVALGGIAVLWADAPRLFAGLTGRALPIVVVSALAGLVSLVLLVQRRYVAVRATAALAVAAVVWGWAVAQYPYLLLPDATVAKTAADPAVLRATLAVLAVGTLLLVPSLLWLFSLFQREHAVAAHDQADGPAPSGHPAA